MTNDRDHKDDPSLHAENDDAPFHRTSEVAAAARQSGDKGGVRPGESVHATDKPLHQTEEIAASSNLTRAHSSSPVRARRADEVNPELDKD